MNDANIQGAVAEEVNRRLDRATQELVEKYARGEGGRDESDNGPTGAAYKEKYRQEALRAKGRKKENTSAESDARAERDDEEEDEDEDVELRQLREQRMKKLQQAHREKIENLGKGHGQYREIVQDEFLAEVTSSTYVVCHFYHRDFPRCEIMNNHISKLVSRHIEAKFVKINAEKAPFFVEKVRVPIVACVCISNELHLQIHLVENPDNAYTSSFH